MSAGSEDPTTIGPFVVHRKLGEGAMGVVYAGYDVSLDRKVALKLVRRQLLDRPSVRDRMVREAKAMARLSSPHVVQVFQVGPHRDGIYVAMEYVEGVSLGVWLKAERRPWQAVLRTVCGAGRGLAAAHAAGLVHRDFKPDNVLVDEAGHARVLDFGLVHTEGAGAAPGGEAEELTQSWSGVEDTVHSSVPGGAGGAAGTNGAGPAGDAVERSNIHWSVRLTQFGRAVGTPAYMSPEQHFSEAVGPYSDQYSFAVTLYEALYGVRPFNADSWDSLKAQVRRGDVPPPPDTRVPGWVHKVVARGLAVEPDQRWPSVQAMVDALERDPRRATRAVGVAALLAVASGASYAVAAARAHTEDRCGGGVEELVGVWDDARRQEVTRAFTATGASFADDVLRRAEARLDGYTTAWAAEHRTACEANVAGSQTSHLLDLRMACLGRRKMHLSALVDVLATADRSVVENAVQAVAALPSLKTCGDAEALMTVAPPADAAAALRVDQLRRQLAQAEVFEDTGRFEQGLALAKKVRGEAATLGYAPLEAEAALGEGSLLMAIGRTGDAEASLVQAVQLAIVHDLRAVAAEAAAKRVFVLSYGLRQSEAALAIRPVAEALVQRAQDDGRLAALLHNNLGVAYAIAGQYDAGVTHVERTIALLQARPGPPDPLLAVTHHNLGTMFMDQGKPERARAPFAASYELFVRAVGERHPHAAYPLVGLGDVALAEGAYAEARQHYEQALGLMSSAFGADHPYLMQVLVGLGRVYARTGAPEQARASFERAIAAGDKPGVHDPMLAEALVGLGDLEAQGERTEEARRRFERAVEVFEAAHEAGKLADAAVRAGEVAGRAGDHAAAIGWYEKALALPAGAKAEVRAAAAVGLARELAARPEARARVCDLLAEARMSLPDGPLRTESDALQAGCAAPTG